MTEQNKNFDTDDISLGDVFEFFWHNRYFLLVAAISAVLGASQQRAKNPRFISSAMVQVQKSTSSPMQALSEKLAGLGGGATSDNPAETTKLFFVSRELYRHVAKTILARPDARQIQKDLGAENLPTDQAAFQSESAQMALSDRLSELAGAETASKETIRLWVKGNSPETTMKVANLLLEEGVRKLAESHVSELTEATSFITSKLSDLESEIKERQELVLSLRQKIGLTVGQMDLKDLPNPMNRLRETLANSEAELRQRNNLLTEMRPRIESGHADYSSVTKYEKLQDEKKFWTSANRSLRETLKSMEGSDHGATGIEQSMLNTMREIEFQYRFYGDLKSQLMQTEMMKISIMNRVRALESASEASTFRTSGAVDTYLVVAAFLAMIITSLGMFVLQSAHPKIRNRNSLDSLPISYLGEVPDFKNELSFVKKIFSPKTKSAHLLWQGLKSKTIFDSPETMVFRTIRSKLIHLVNSDSKKCPIICVTSPKPGSGKTMISENLGCLLSMGKKKTLLIDCDLRLGGLTAGFDLGERQGLSDYLSSELSDWHSIIEPCTEHLHVLSRGRQLSNPAELLSDDRMSGLLEELKKEYDYIILDTTPVLGLAETDIITKISDLVLVVLVRQQTRLTELKDTLEHLKFNDVDKIGYVLNRSGHYVSQPYFAQSKAA